MLKLLIAFIPNEEGTGVFYSLRSSEKGTYWCPDLKGVCDLYLTSAIPTLSLIAMRVTYDMCLEFETVEELLDKQDEIKMHILMEN